MIHNFNESELMGNFFTDVLDDIEHPIQTLERTGTGLANAVTKPLATGFSNISTAAGSGLKNLVSNVGEGAGSAVSNITKPLIPILIIAGVGLAIYAAVKFIPKGKVHNPITF
jgi:phage-related protein